MPTKSTLERLDLADIVEDLEKRGISLSSNDFLKLESY